MVTGLAKGGSTCLSVIEDGALKGFASKSGVIAGPSLISKNQNGFEPTSSKSSLKVYGARGRSVSGGDSECPKVRTGPYSSLYSHKLCLVSKQVRSTLRNPLMVTEHWPWARSPAGLPTESVTFWSGETEGQHRAVDAVSTCNTAVPWLDPRKNISKNDVNS